MNGTEVQRVVTTILVTGVLTLLGTTVQLGQDYFTYTLKKELPFAFFFNYHHAIKTQEGIIS